MSFEKKMQKRGNDKLNQFAKNPYHQEVTPVAPTPKKRFPVWASVLIPSVAVASLIVIMVPAMIMMAPKGNAAKPANYDDYSPQEGSKAPAQPDRSQTPMDYSTKDGEGSQTYTVPNWENATILEKYPEFSYQDNSYYIRYTDSSKPIDATYINTKIADITVDPNYIYQSQSYPNIEAELYSIKNIALDASLAIKFKDSEDYYAYQNISCYFANIGELLNKVSFATEVEFSSIIYNYFDENGQYERIEYKNASKDSVMNILFNDQTIVNQKTKQRLYLTSETSEPNPSSGGYTPAPQTRSNVVFVTKIACLGIDNASIQLYTSGLLDVNLFGTLSSYQLGEERYQSLISYITSLSNN